MRAVVSTGASGIGETGAVVATVVHAKLGSSSSDVDTGIVVGEEVPEAETSEER
jgi:hypothetical protein